MFKRDCCIGVGAFESSPELFKRPFLAARAFEKVQRCESVACARFVQSDSRATFGAWWFFAFDLRRLFVSKRLNHETDYGESLTKFVAKGGPLAEED